VIRSILSRRSLAVAVAFAVSFAASAQTASFEPKVQGWELGANIDTQKLASAIAKALGHYNWRSVESKSGFIKAVYEKSGGNISATIDVRYGESGYVIEYVDSKNLDADLKRKVIHRNYVRWIANLNKAIYTYYSGS
jgi:hypothetical protein